jgi:predicted transcriptional regulator
MLEEWKNGKQVISQKELAEKFGRDPSKVSKAAAGLKGIWKEK